MYQIKKLQISASMRIGRTHFCLCPIHVTCVS